MEVRLEEYRAYVDTRRTGVPFPFKCNLQLTFPRLKHLVLSNIMITEKDIDLLPSNLDSISISGTLKDPIALLEKCKNLSSIDIPCSPKYLMDYTPSSGVEHVHTLTVQCFNLEHCVDLARRFPRLREVLVILYPKLGVEEESLQLFFEVLGSKLRTLRVEGSEKQLLSQILYLPPKNLNIETLEITHRFSFNASKKEIAMFATCFPTLKNLTIYNIGFQTGKLNFLLQTLRDIPIQKIYLHF
jgi:hypothetical protein